MNFQVTGGFAFVLFGGLVVNIVCDLLLVVWVGVGVTILV